MQTVASLYTLKHLHLNCTNSSVLWLLSIVFWLAFSIFLLYKILQTDRSDAHFNPHKANCLYTKLLIDNKHICERIAEDYQVCMQWVQWKSSDIFLNCKN